MTAIDSRGQQRSSMFLAAALRTGAEQAPVRVRNMSPNGAMFESPVTPTVGAEVDLMRGALVARGTVIWSSGNKSGVRFCSEVCVKDWLSAPTKVQQQRVDEIVALVKAGRTDPRFEDESTQTPRSHEQLIEDLGAVVGLMQDLEDDLAASDATLERHGVKLQNLDIAMQMLRAVASELATVGGSGHVNLARLRDLRVACTQAMSAG